MGADAPAVHAAFFGAPLNAMMSKLFWEDSFSDFIDGSDAAHDGFCRPSWQVAVRIRAASSCIAMSMEQLLHTRLPQL